MKTAFPAAVPEIPVRDVDTALAYYKDKLGFTVDWADAQVGLAGISRGSCRLFLASAEYRQARGTGGPVLIWLNLDSKDDVNELHRLWSSSRATLVSAPESKEYGLHEFTAKDTDGNLFRVFYDFGTADRSSA